MTNRFSKITKVKKEDLTPDEVAELIENNRAGDEAGEIKKKLHRLTLDMPPALFEKIKSEAKGKGFTVKGFLLGLVDRYFDGKDERQG